MTKGTVEIPVKTKRKITRLKNLREQLAEAMVEMKRLEEQISAEVVEMETSFTYRNIPVVYMPGHERVYWNGTKLGEYAKEHPGEIDDYAKKSTVPAYGYLKI
jgi:hypothetical protein